MLTAHRLLAFLVVGVPALAALAGGFVVLAPARARGRS